MRDDRTLIRTRDDLLELIARALHLQLSYLSKDQALAVGNTILWPASPRALWKTDTGLDQRCCGINSEQLALH